MKKFLKIFLVTLIFCTEIFLPMKVFAADIWAAAAEAAGIYAAYKSTLTSMLRLGNNVNAQMAARRQDIEKNGQDKNNLDVKLVDEILTRLVNNAEYELRVNSLPFVWNVNDSEQFNASCYPMNYISINRGLIRNFNLNEDEIASVLAHEMTHGIEQHSAKNYAKAVAQSLGAMVIGMNVNSTNIDWGKMAGMVNYSIAKSIALPAEHEADEGGFFLMTSAGFNPGGSAAAMARMNYYVRYETQNFWEFDPHDKPNEQTMSDHPDTEVREEKLSKLLTDYSYGHVTVKKVERIYKVFIDDEEIFTAENLGEIYKNAERAYFFAGGLARAFHEKNSADEWNFHEVSENRTDFLTDEKVYKTLRETSRIEKLGEKIQSAVISAYENENPEVKQKYLAEENKRREYWQKIKSENISAKKIMAERLRVNADVYNDYGQGELALKEIARAMEAENQDNMAECFSIRGRAKAICGDDDGALIDVNFAVEQDSKNLYNFLNRADVFHMRGEIDSALADIDTAIKIDAKNPMPYKLLGDIFDELGKFELAEVNYRNCYFLSKKNLNLIPKNYLEKIDPKVAEKINKEKDKAQEKKKD